MSETDEREEWRPVDGFPYEVSNLGRVRRVNRATDGRCADTLAVEVDHRGYERVQLSDGPRVVHRFVQVLVAGAFIGPKPAGMQVNHRDGNKRNNTVANLEYVTPRENIRHAVAMGLAPTGARHGSRTRPDRVPRGERHGCAKLDADRVRAMRAAHERGVSTRALAREYGVSQVTARRVVAGILWRHVS